MTELLFAFGWTLGIGVAVPVAVFAIALLHRPALHYHYHVHRSADEDAPTRTRTVPVLLPPVCQIAAKPQRALPPPAPAAHPDADTRAGCAAGASAPLEPPPVTLTRC